MIAKHKLLCCQRGYQYKVKGNHLLGWPYSDLKSLHILTFPSFFGTGTTLANHSG